MFRIHVAKWGESLLSLSVCLLWSVYVCLCVSYVWRCLSRSPTVTNNFMSVSEYLCVSPVKCLCVFINLIDGILRNVAPFSKLHSWVLPRMLVLSANLQGKRALWLSLQDCTQIGNKYVLIFLPQCWENMFQGYVPQNAIEKTRHILKGPERYHPKVCFYSWPFFSIRGVSKW